MDVAFNMLNILYVIMYVHMVQCVHPHVYTCTGCRTLVWCTLMIGCLNSICVYNSAASLSHFTLQSKSVDSIIKPTHVLTACSLLCRLRCCWFTAEIFTTSQNFVTAEFKLNLLGKKWQFFYTVHPCIATYIYFVIGSTEMLCFSNCFIVIFISNLFFISVASVKFCTSHWLSQKLLGAMILSFYHGLGGGSSMAHFVSALPQHRDLPAAYQWSHSDSWVHVKLMQGACPAICGLICLKPAADHGFSLGRCAT